MEASFLSSVLLPFCLGFIMFGLGLGLVKDDFTRVLRQPKATLLGLFCQLVVLPLIAFMLACFFHLKAHFAIGLMLVSFVPGAVTSNFFTSLAKGNVALSVSLTALVSLIAPMSLPVLLSLSINYFGGMDSSLRLPFSKTVMTLFSITLIPVSLGMLVRHFSSPLAQKWESPMTKLSTGILLLIVLGLLKNHWHIVPQSFGSVGLVCLLFNCLTLASGFGVARLAKLPVRDAVTIAIESGFQSSAMALFISGTLLKQPMISIVPAVYSLIMLFTGSLFVYFISKRDKVLRPLVQP